MSDDFELVSATHLVEDFEISYLVGLVFLIIMIIMMCCKTPIFRVRVFFSGTGICNI